MKGALASRRDITQSNILGLIAPLDLDMSKRQQAGPFASPVQRYLLRDDEWGRPFDPVGRSREAGASVPQRGLPAGLL